jgi:hypothetical protein
MSIADLERDLAECTQNYASGVRHALADALLAIAHPTSFRSILMEFLDSEARLGDVAGRSFWHDNGFAKIVLLSHSSYKLRLHIWQKSAGFPTSSGGNIHNHRWDFSTILLAGGYRHQEFRQSADGETFFAYKYSTAGTHGTYQLAPAGSQTLRCVFDAHLSQGSGFTASSEVLHRVTPDASGPTVSLVLEGPHQPSTSDVFAINEVSNTSDALVEGLSTDYLRRHMMGVLSLSAFT